MNVPKTSSDTMFEITSILREMEHWPAVLTNNRD
jgi:hypothetical protein